MMMMIMTIMMMIREADKIRTVDQPVDCSVSQNRNSLGWIYHKLRQQQNAPLSSPISHLHLKTATFYKHR